MLKNKRKLYQWTTLLGLGLLTAGWGHSATADCHYEVTNSWSNGFTALVRVTNHTTAPVNSWQVNWSYTGNSITNSWNANLSGNYTATPLGWNAVIQPGQFVEFGFQGVTNGGAIETPTLNGDLCNTTATSSASSASSVTSSSAITNGNNIAPLALASTSYVSPWETLAALNDNATPAHSNDKSAGAYGNWNNPDSIQWVQYEWSQPYAFTGTQIYWFDDNGGVLTPTQAWVEYWNGSHWINAGDVPLQKDAFNTVALQGIVSSRLRVSMRNASQSTGMLEWRVSGTPAGNVSSSSSSAQSSSSSSTGTVAQCSAYQWPEYQPDLDYDFRTDFGTVDPSQFRIYYGCPQNRIAGVKTMGRFAFIWGPNRNPQITDAHIDRVLRDLNEDADYIHNVMGWPVDRLQAEGYYSNVYLYGSGLCTDNAPNTDRGGWQSGINGYPMVLLSYYPVITPNERGGITHEFIHTIMATRGNKAAWFNEGGNTWLQMNLEADRTGQYGVGFLDGAPLLAPHMPIENYSGWLQDGSFGGPNAEGVNRNANGGQISTWRHYLGGNQYNSVFSHFLAEHVSKGANAWLWAKGPYNHILRSLESGLGEEQTQHLIMEYRARQAMMDFGPWSNALKVPVNNNWGRTIGAEPIPNGIWQQPPAHRLSFYAATQRQGNTLTPATDTLPGWSGANQIPLQTSGNKVRVNFQPIAHNMRLQLAYRAQDGSAVYSQPVENGEACLDLAKAPKNGVVVAVVSNVDHLYNGEETRTRKHDYRIELIEGVSGTAPLYTKHYE